VTARYARTSSSDARRRRRHPVTGFGGIRSIEAARAALAAGVQSHRRHGGMGERRRARTLRTIMGAQLLVAWTCVTDESLFVDGPRRASRPRRGTGAVSQCRRRASTSPPSIVTAPCAARLALYEKACASGMASSRPVESEMRRRRRARGDWMRSGVMASAISLAGIEFRLLTSENANYVSVMTTCRAVRRRRRRRATHQWHRSPLQRIAMGDQKRRREISEVHLLDDLGERLAGVAKLPGSRCHC